MKASLFAAFAVLAFAAAAACGGGQPEPNVPSAVPSAAPSAPAPVDTSAAPAASASAAAAASAADAGAPAAVAAAPKSWNDMTHEERLGVMKTKVMPKMKEAFQGFDAKDFADFSCETCHGAGIKQGKFDMPNPKLPVLDPAGGFKKEQEKHPKMLKFMATVVSPQMAELLGLPHYDPATHSGFGCAGCHTFAK